MERRRPLWERRPLSQQATAQNGGVCHVEPARVGVVAVAVLYLVGVVVVGKGNQTNELDTSILLGFWL